MKIVSKNFRLNSSSVFIQEPFQEFVYRFFMGMSNDSSSVEQMIKEREQYIKMKHYDQINKIESQLLEQKVDLDLYKEKKYEIEKWAVKQHTEIQQTKNKVQWIVGLDTYIQTKRNLKLINQIENKIDIRKSWTQNYKLPDTQQISNYSGMLDAHNNYNHPPY